MPSALSTIASLRQRYLSDEANPVEEIEAALARSNSNAGHNVYLARDPAWTRAEARKLRGADIEKQPLWGIPVSLKDCFDLEGFPTSCGSSFYREQHGIAPKDSAVGSRLRSAGAVITGKTHLHQLAYGITGQNADFGDCAQPRDATLLTGGSSSGAAASVQEGSALAAIGTDTGGSIRVPAALCGLSGYRSSITLGSQALWRGGAHLAPSFDTLGWLYRELADGPALGNALFDLPFAPSPECSTLKIGIPGVEFLHDCEPDVLAMLERWQESLASQEVALSEFDATFWNDARSIFAPIQASEGAVLHHGHFQHFEPLIAERLAWGESLSSDELAKLRSRHSLFREQTAALFETFDYLLLPAAPMTELRVADDHAETRTRILRYTTPTSLCGLPTVTLPGGLQLVAPLNRDAPLLALSAALEIPATLQR